MFDIPAKLVGEQDEISNVDKIHWEKLSWKHLSLIGDETVINLQHTKVYVFSDSVLCLGKIHQHPESNEAWKKRIEGIATDQSYRDYDGGQGDGVPKTGLQQAVAGPRGSRTCVCANTSIPPGGTCRE